MKKGWGGREEAGLQTKCLMQSGLFKLPMNYSSERIWVQREPSGRHIRQQLLALEPAKRVDACAFIFRQHLVDACVTRLHRSSSAPP